MEKKIIQLYDADKTEDLTKLVKGLSGDQINGMLKKYSALGKMEGTSLLKGLLVGATDPEQRGLIFKVAFRILRDGIAKGMFAVEMGGILMEEADYQAPASLIEVVDCFMEALKGKDEIGQRVYDVFPKILSTLASRDMISHENNHMNGKEFKSHILNTLCSGRWESHTAVPLTTMFKDIALSTDEVTFVVEKVLRMMSKLDLQVLPGVIYQLVLLESIKGSKKKVMYDICSFLAGLDDKYQQLERTMDEGDIVSDGDSLATLRMTEATTVTHIVYAMKLDNDRASDFLKLLKVQQQSNPRFILSPFVIALALSVAHDQFAEEGILEVLKKTIFQSFQDAEKAHKCKWMSDFLPEPCDVSTALCDVAKRDFTKTGLEQVSHGLVKLAFLLMESYGPKPSPFGKDTGRSPQSKGANQKTCDLAINILKNLFDGQESIQVDILERTLNSFLTNTSRVCTHYVANQKRYGQAINVLKYLFDGKELTQVDILERMLNSFLTNTSRVCTHYVDLFRALVKTAPLTVISSLNKLINTLDYLGMFSTATAEGILQALQPLLQINVSLKDTLMLILRKAMFAREIESRKIAVIGYLQILKHFQVLGSLPMSLPWSQDTMPLCSQGVSVEVHGRKKMPPNYEALVCAEIIGNLRRCLTQPSEVRKTLYKGLYGVICHNSRLLGPVLKLLLHQLETYLGTEPPLKLDSTIVTQGEKVTLVEPLGSLLHSLIQCMIKARRMKEVRATDIIDQVDEEEEGEETLDEVLNTATEKISALRDELTDCEMEDFSLDKAADFSSSTSVGVKNTLLATQLKDVYDILLELTLTESDKISMEAVDQALKLFKQRSQLDAVMTDKGNQGTGKKAKAAKPSKKTVPSNISLHCLSHTLNSMFGDPLSDQEAITRLKDDSNFCHFMISISLDKLKLVKGGSESKDNSAVRKERLFQALCVLARVFLDQVNTGLYQTARPTAKQKTTTALALEGLELTTSIVCSQFQTKLIMFLQELEPSIVDQPEEGSAANGIHVILKKLQRMFIDVLTTDADNRVLALKDSGSFPGIFGIFSKELDIESEQFAQVHTWITKVCTDYSMEEPSIAKKMLSLHWDLTVRVKSGGSLIRSVAQDLHSTLGDIDKDAEVEDRTNFAAVNSKNAHQVTLLMLSWCDRLMDEVVWLLNNKMARNSNSSVSENALDDSQSDDSFGNLEKIICNQLGLLINSFHEFTQTAVPLGLPMNNSVKSLTKLYDALTLLAKFFLSLYTSGSGQFSGRYEKLVKLSGIQLTQFVYPFITYVQATQSEKLSYIPKTKSKKKKKKVDGGLMKGKAGVVMREGRLIPNLIYAIENYERFIIRLGKKSKVNLLQEFKLSTIRDFRILTAKLDENSDESEESSEEEDNENEENTKPKAKKQKK